MFFETCLGVNIKHRRRTNPKTILIFDFKIKCNDSKSIHSYHFTYSQKILTLLFKIQIFTIAHLLTLSLFTKCTTLGSYRHSCNFSEYCVLRSDVAVYSQFWVSQRGTPLNICTIDTLCMKTTLVLKWICCSSQNFPLFLCLISN